MTTQQDRNKAAGRDEKGNPVDPVRNANIAFRHAQEWKKAKKGGQ